MGDRHRSRSRVVASHIPLFNSYVFVYADLDERLLALKTQRVITPLNVTDQDELWVDLRRTAQLIATGSPITAEDRLEPGDRVSIRSGPLAGMEGTVVRRSSSRRFVVSVNFIQKGASVLLDDFDLAAVN